jgi:hypothetical protein
MLSTYLSYQMYARDMERSLARIQSDPFVTREAAYYQEHIGQVASVDDLLDDFHLYNYAMRMAGLDDMIDAKAFIRKVLESDLKDPESFANKLVDRRYVEFAKMFNFGADGKVKATPALAQADYQTDDITELYSEHRLRRGVVAASETAYYQERLPQITSVDGFLANDRLFTYALTAYGIDAAQASKAAIRDVLLSDPSDPGSAANQLGPKYAALAAAFDFGADGSVPIGGVQSEAALTETVFEYYENSGNDASPAVAALRANNYREKIATLTSVDDLVNDRRLLDVAMTAAGLDAVLQNPAVIRQVLTSDLSDPSSEANVRGGAYRVLAEAFNFHADGTINGSAAQTAQQLENTVSRYFILQDNKAEFLEGISTAAFKARINTILTVDNLLNDTQLFTYVMKAFDLDPATESKTMIRRVLTSDLTDPRSVANRASDKPYKELAAAFNFNEDGTVGMARIAQTKLATDETIERYTADVDLKDTAEVDKVKRETTYYQDQIGNIRSVDDLIRDKRLVAYLTRAYELGEEQITDRFLRDVLTSDPFDPESFANEQSNTGFRDLAAAFNFTAEGGLDREPALQPQTRGDIIRAADDYLRQTMEQRAGEENPGVRLALYFERKAPVIDSAFDILADKALYEVVRTALGLPLAVAQASTEAQARMIERRLKVEDLQDPKKLARFLTQFTTLYDIENGNSTIPSIVSLIGPVTL